MSEWKEVRLGEICHYVTDRIDCSVLNKDNYISTENMAQNCGGVSDATNVPDGKCIAFKENDVLFSNIRPYFKKLWKADFDGGCSADVLCIRANNNVNQIYLYYLLTQDSFISYVMKGSKGCKMPRGDKEFNMKWKISIPSLSTQHQIASILSALDDKIAVNRRICENLESQAQALFKHWFIDFTPFKDGKFVESELGMIPEGWRVGTLGDVVNQVTDKVGEKNNVRVLSPINIGKLVLSDEFFTKQVYSKSISKYIIVNPNDFAYNPARVNIGSIGRNEYEFMGCVSPVYVVFHCQEHYHYFIDFFRHGSKFKKNVEKLAIGGVRQTLRYEDLARIPLVIPPTEVIISFNDIYKKMYAVIIKKNQESSRLSTLRDTLLPKLMSGQIKV